MASRKVSDEEAVGELARWHDWLVSVEGETEWGETTLEALRRIIPLLLLAVEAAAAEQHDGAVLDLLTPPPEQGPAPAPGWEPPGSA